MKMYMNPQMKIKHPRNENDIKIKVDAIKEDDSKEEYDPVKDDYHKMTTIPRLQTIFKVKKTMFKMLKILKIPTHPPSLKNKKKVQKALYPCPCCWQ